MTAPSRIWTLDARNNVLLEAMSSYLDMSDRRMRQEILDAHTTLRNVLESKGISYDRLRASLVPQVDKLERAYVFDSSAIENPSYGWEVASRVVPRLDREMSCSILHGDLAHDDRERLLGVLDSHLQAYRPLTVADPALLYVAYMNNLSRRRAEEVHSGLKSFPAYIGYVDTTFGSPIKDFMSAVLSNAYLKLGDRWVCGHEDDAPNEEDFNVLSWPLAENGYLCSSVQATYFGLFLSYKVERAVHPGFESDTYFALAAISACPSQLTDADVVVEEAKAEYLHREKAGSLARAGLAAITATELRSLLRAKIQESYIYDLRYLPDHGTSLFDVMVEIPVPGHATPSRMLAAFEYQADGNLKLVTFY